MTKIFFNKLGSHSLNNPHLQFTVNKSPLKLMTGCYLIHYLIISHIVISAHSSTNFRCSHVPPTPEQVSHVWLTDSTSSNDGSGYLIDSIKSSTNMVEGRDAGVGEEPIDHKTKRHVNHRDNLVNPDSSGLGSLLNIFRQFNHDVRLTPEPIKLVPMKIQVFYDDSVNRLEKSKYELIVDTVIPSVVKFFEGVLSIRHDFTINQFRIARRCPNNTIYYGRDPMGTPRAFCKDRCENYAICGEMVVPKSHLAACSYCNSTSKRCITNFATEGKGVADAQLLLYVSANQTARCRKDQTIAYAAHCVQDAKTDRPVAGHANLCPSSISTDPKDLRALIATVKHELTHVLGFSVSLFAYYRDEFGYALTDRDSLPGPIMADPKTGYAKWSEKVIKRVTRSDWITGQGKIDRDVHLIVTPTVVREARRHFNCSELEGAELEDQGSDGTSMTHWEKRLFENEAMTGTHTQNSVYSRLTLAVLQDTGWYVANFSRAEKLDWGKNLGCDFAKKSCKSWIDQRRAQGLSIRPFCDRVKSDPLQISCTEDRTSKAVCNMKYYKEPLPEYYQNFDYIPGVSKTNLSHYGGSVDLADFCPFIQEFTWQAQNVSVRGSRCDLIGNNVDSERNAALEFYGPHTKCFEHGRRWEQRSCIYKRHWHHYGAGCYRYSCANGHISVSIGNHSFPCYYQDQIVRIELMVDQWMYNGTLICPSCENICPSHKCKSFDKSLVDKVLMMSQDTISGENDLSVLVDGSANSIEFSDPPSTLKNKAIFKQRFLEKNHSNYLHEFDKARDYLYHIFMRQRQLPRHELQCSAAISFIFTPGLHHILLITLALICNTLDLRNFTYL